MKEIGPNGIEAYFKREVKKAGGMTEKHVSPGKKDVPDQLTTWPYKMHLVELKAPRTRGKVRKGQERDHKRRAKYGVYVHILHTKETIDAYIRVYGENGPRVSGNNSLMTAPLFGNSAAGMMRNLLDN